MTIKIHKQKSKLSTPAVIVTISLILVLFLTLLSGIIGTSNNPCTKGGCHGSGVTEYVNLLPSDSGSSLPTVFQVSQSLTVEMVVEVDATGSISTYPECYKIDVIKVTLSSLHDKVTIQNAQQQVTNKKPNDKVTFQWNVTGAEGGDDTLIFDLFANNSHKNEPSRATTFTDTYFHDITVNDVPGKPQNLLIRAGDGFIELTWQAPSFAGGVPITGYKVYRGIITGGESYLNSVSETTFKYNDTSVTNGQTYYYYVTATNSIGESKASVEVFATPQLTKTKPTVPQSLNITVGRDFIHLDWQAPSYDGGSAITVYRLFRGTSSGSGEFLNSITSSVTEYNDSSVSSGITYFYNVTAKNAYGESDSSNEVSGTPDAEPPTVSIVSPPENTYVNSKSLTVQCSGSDSISGIDHYEIKLDNDKWQDQGTALLITFTSLAEGKHTIYVKAVDGMGNTNVTSVTFTVDLEAPVIKITSPENDSFLNTESVQVIWESSDTTSGLDHYEIRIDGGFWINAGKEHNHTFDSLTDGIHIVEVKAEDITQNIMIAGVSFTVDASEPTIISYTPKGIGVLLDSVVIITFSEEMKRSSIFITVTNIQGSVSWDEDTVTFTPKKDLEYGTEYIVEVSGSDLLGNRMLPFNWSFTTKEQEKITGQILDENNKPIDNAIIILDHDQTTTTDNTGSFSINVQPGSYNLVINKTGYKDNSINVTISTDEVKDLGNIKLSKVEKLTDIDDKPDGEDSKSGSGSTLTSGGNLVIIAVITVVIIIIVLILLYLLSIKSKKNKP